MTLSEQARSVAHRLESAGIPAEEARLDAELLMRSTLGWDRARWIAESPASMPSNLADRLEPLVARREAREPMAYILGRCEFWGREFEVGPGVLVPRPETELIVELALARLGPGDAATAIDMGTGSGCLAVTLALERPGLRLVATDVSQAALDVARRNAVRHGVSDRIVFRHAPLLGDALDGGMDLIVSNPPYVPVRDRATLQPEVASYEPPDALFAGEDGLDVIRDLLRETPRGLRAGGWLVFEFGFGQGPAVRELLAAPGVWRTIEIVADLQGIPRTAVARRA